jgi:anti-sigma B factor antagonist
LETICQAKVISKDIQLVSLEGDLDSPNSANVKNYLLSLLQQGARRLIIDLNKIRILDSLGLTVLTSIQMKAKSLGGDIVLLFDNPPLHKLFHITGLEEYIRIYRSPSDIAELGEGKN